MAVVLKTGVQIHNGSSKIVGVNWATPSELVVTTTSQVLVYSTVDNTCKKSWSFRPGPNTVLTHAVSHHPVSKCMFGVQREEALVCWESRDSSMKSKKTHDTHQSICDLHVGRALGAGVCVVFKNGELALYDRDLAQAAKGGEALPAGSKVVWSGLAPAPHQERRGRSDASSHIHTLLLTLTEVERSSAAAVPATPRRGRRAAAAANTPPPAGEGVDLVLRVYGVRLGGGGKGASLDLTGLCSVGSSPRGGNGQDEAQEGEGCVDETGVVTASFLPSSLSLSLLRRSGRWQLFRFPRGGGWFNQLPTATGSAAAAAAAAAAGPALVLERLLRLPGGEGGVPGAALACFEPCYALVYAPTHSSSSSSLNGISNGGSKATHQGQGQGDLTVWDTRYGVSVASADAAEDSEGRAATPSSNLGPLLALSPPLAASGDDSILPGASAAAAAAAGGGGGVRRGLIALLPWLGGGGVRLCGAAAGAQRQPGLGSVLGRMRASQQLLRQPVSAALCSVPSLNPAAAAAAAGDAGVWRREVLSGEEQERDVIGRLADPTVTPDAASFDEVFYSHLTSLGFDAEEGGGVSSSSSNNKRRGRQSTATGVKRARGGSGSINSSSSSSEASAALSPALASAVLQRAVSSPEAGLWRPVETLVKAGAVSFRASPPLLLLLLKRKQLSLLRLCLLHIPDISERCLLRLLRGLLQLAAKRPRTLRRHATAAAAAAAGSDSEEVGGGLLPALLPFLDLVVRALRSPVLMLRAMKLLRGEELRLLLSYLHLRLLQLTPRLSPESTATAEAAATAAAAGGVEAEAGWGVMPSFEQVVEWVALLLDARFLHLCMESAPAEASAAAAAPVSVARVLKDLRVLCGEGAELCLQLGQVAGPLGALLAKQSLPQRTVSDYTVETIVF